MVAKAQQVQAIPMLATALAWQRLVADEPAAGPLRDLIADLCQRLLSHFEGFVTHTVRYPFGLVLARLGNLPS